MEKRKPKFEIGDLVKIINYGGCAWFFKSHFPDPPTNTFSQTEDTWNVDTQPHLVGQIATVANQKTTQGIPKYTLKFDHGEVSWFSEQQMELINENSIP